MSDKKYGFETRAIHVGQEKVDEFSQSRGVPIYQTTSFVFKNSDQAEARFGLKDAGNIYGRLTNSTNDVFEKRIASLEDGAAAISLASGAAAVTYAFKSVAHNGDNIVSAKNIYGGTFNLLKHTFEDDGVHTTFVDPFDLKAVENAIKDNTKALYIESLGNPNGEVVDIEAWAEIAHRHGLPLLVDNTFGTPVLVRPIDYGADIVIHSATKFIGGHGTTLGGVVVDAGKFDWTKGGKWPWLSTPNISYHGVVFAQTPAPIATYIRAIVLRDEGAVLPPFSAWALLQGTETLALRVKKESSNALKVVEYLENNPQVEYVSHPAASKNETHKKLYKKYFPHGGGSIFTFDIKGSEKKARDFIDNLEIFSLLANVADVKSLVIHPASTTHSECTEEELEDQGIKRNTVRLSIGAEDAEDIIADLDQAFEKVKDEK